VCIVFVLFSKVNDPMVATDPVVATFQFELQILACKCDIGSTDGTD